MHNARNSSDRLRGIHIGGGNEMILDLNDREKVTLRYLNDIKETCDLILNGNTRFLKEDLNDIKEICDYIARDNFNRLANEY